jgi:hypothetical protein
MGLFVVLLAVVPFASSAQSASDLGGAAASGALGAIPGVDLVKALSSAGSAVDYVAQGVAYLIFMFAGIILWIVGELFNFVILNTVFDFKDFFGANTAGVLAAWGVVRDVANIALIFGFVAMGVATMLDIHGYEAKKTLPRLVIFAVLLNFSLLASEAVIDVSNLFSSVLYTQSATEDCKLSATGDTTQKCATDPSYGPSGYILENAGLGSVLEYKTWFSGLADPQKWVVVYLGLAIFVSITAVVLLAATILFLVRAVVLVFLMILSPIGFAGLAVPPLERYAKQWWDALLKQSFFAPLFLLLMVISIKIMQTVGNLHFQNGSAEQARSLADTLALGDTSSIQAVFMFAVMTGFMIATIILSKQMGAMGAGFATEWATKAVAYPFGWAARNTYGAAGHYGQKAFNRYAGRVAAQYGQLQPKTALGRAGKWIGGQIGSNVAEGVSGAIGGVANTKYAGASYNERAKQQKTYQQDIEHADHKAQAEAAIKRSVDARAAAVAMPQDTEEQKTARDAAMDAAGESAAETLQKMSTKEIAEVIKDGNKELAETVARALSPETFAKAMDSDDIAADKKHVMQDARFEELTTAITDATRPDQKNNPLTDRQQKRIKRQIRDMTEKDAEQFAKALKPQFDALINASDSEDHNRSYLSEDLLDKLSKSNHLTEPQRRLAKENTSFGRIERWAASEDLKTKEAAQELFKSLTAENKMKIKASTLIGKNPDDYGLLGKVVTGQDVNAVVAKNKFNDVQTAKLLKLLESTQGEQREYWNNFFRNNRLAASNIGWNQSGADAPQQPRGTAGKADYSRPA